MNAETAAPGAVVVLIAEDERPIAAVLATLVEEAGYTPLLAAHGRQALELARTQRPALIISDVMMPYLDGAELIAALRGDAAREGHAAVPVILVTAASLAYARAAGAAAVLAKPFDLTQVEALLHRFLGALPCAPGGTADA